MVHERQGLTLGLEPRDHLPGVHSQFDNLEGNAPFDRLLLLGQIDYAEPAVADFLQEFVAPDFIARFLTWN
jgi:hypothetical protein